MTIRARERLHWLCQKERTSSSRFFKFMNWRKSWVVDSVEYSTTTDDDVDGALHDVDKKSWSRCWWWCPTAPGDRTREQGRWHRWDVSHFSCRNCNSSRQTIWHTILQGYFNDFKSFLDCFDENSELDNLLDFLCFNHDLGIEYAYSRPATSLANPSREQVNMEEFYKSNQIWNAWELPIGQPNLFFLKVDTLRQSIWLAGDTGTGRWSFQGVIFWSVGE